LVTKVGYRALTDRYLYTTLTLAPPPADVAIATAIFLTITQVGGAVGGSIAGAVWSTYLPRRLHRHLPADGIPHIPQILASLPYALSFPPGSPIRLGIDKAYVDVQRVLNGLAMGMLLPGLVAMCSMRNVNLAAEDHSVGEGVVVLGRASFLGAFTSVSFHLASCSTLNADVPSLPQPARKTTSLRAKLQVCWVRFSNMSTGAERSGLSRTPSVLSVSVPHVVAFLYPLHLRCRSCCASWNSSVTLFCYERKLAYIPVKGASDAGLLSLVGFISLNYVASALPARRRSKRCAALSDLRRNLDEPRK
jgi:hypothetical protein